jgi:PAS domain S-box-containing protein
MSPMSSREGRDPLVAAYASALGRYLAGAGEAALAEGYELGRQAAAHGLGVLDLALLHHEALHGLLATWPPDQPAPALLAGQFLAESLSPFEMTLRAYQASARLLGLGESTTRQNAEIDRAREQLRTILNATTAIIYLKDADGRYLFVNRQFETVFGRPSADVVGRTDAEVLPGPLAAVLSANDARALRAPTPQELEESLPGDDGVHTYLSLKFPLLDAGGVPYALCCVATDITERRRADEALRSAKLDADRAQAEADRANRAKSEFLSRMSHELRTPLNGILGFGQLLAMKGLPPDQRESVDLILQAGRHLLGLINEVLEISRIEAGQLRLSLEPVPVAEILRTAIDLVRPLARDYGIALLAEAAADGRHVLADRQRLQQVLLNLLSNAVKYNRPNGQVHVSCGDVPAGRIQISVTDTGAGMTADQLARLFTPFDRLGAEASRVEGTGLGLTLSKHLVDLMGGRIAVESRLGGGTTFSVQLPAAGEPAAMAPLPSEPSLTQDVAASAPLRVLYVEDNPTNLKLVQLIVGLRPGVELLSAERGRTGLDLARAHLPDLILLDQHLPDMAGDEVLRCLLADPRTRDLPVVILSADAGPGQIRRLLDAGARAYLTKPFDVSKLLALIDQTAAARA